MSSASAAMYSGCMEKQKEIPGLQIWFDRRQGDYFFLKGFWVGSDESPLGRYEGEQFADNTTIVVKPADWPKGKTQQIVLKKSPDVDALINFTVSGQSKSYILLRDPETVPIATQIVNGDVRRITSGGTSDGHSPFCQKRSVEGCVTPRQPGGYLVVGTGTAVEIVQTGRAGMNVTKNSLEQICVEFWAATGACETEVSIQGRPSAVERYPNPTPVNK
jgi:hypothetical protein